MAPVTLCTTPKNAVQLATETEIRRFLEIHPGASEILNTKNAKRPFFQKTILTGHKMETEEIVKNHLVPAEGEIRELIESRFGSIEAIRVKGLFYQGLQDDKVTWKTVLRLILAGTQTDDYTKLRKSCPAGFDRDVYSPNKVLALQGFVPGRTTGFMEQFVQAQDEDVLVWLHEVPTDDERKYKEAKVAFEKTHFKIRNPVGFVRQTETELQLLSRKELFELYENMFIGSEQFVKLWLRDPEIRTYERFDFLPPPRTCPDNVLNTWRGFAAEAIQEPTGSADKFVTHLRTLFGPENSQYVLKWLASLIQKPGEHTGVALVIVGGQGSGKSTAFETFMKKVIGSRYFGQTNNPENDLFSRFGFLKNSKVLVVIDDFNVGTLKMNADPFKAYITGETVPFESKGKMSIELLNCANFVLTTNKHDPVKLDADDRRYAVLEASSVLQGKHEYFRDLYTYLADPANIRAIYELLRDMDIFGTNFQAERPITELYQEIKKMSIDKELMFLHHKVTGFERPQEFKGSEYYQDFRSWLGENGFTDYKAKDAVRFGLYMKKVSGVTVDRRAGNAAYYVIDPKRIPNLP
jgi:Family of unknown function (DUF5906)